MNDYFILCSSRTEKFWNFCDKNRDSLGYCDSCIINHFKDLNDYQRTIVLKLGRVLILELEELYVC